MADDFFIAEKNSNGTESREDKYESELENIYWQISNGDEPRMIFSSIVDATLIVENVSGCALYLPEGKESAVPELYFAKGEEIKDSNILLISSDTIGRSDKNDDYLKLDIVCLGTTIGKLILKLQGELSHKANYFLRNLAHCASVTFEKQRTMTTMQHFLDRLDVLNEFNQLIVSNISLQRIIKNVARDAAFRFTADLAMMLMLNEDGSLLELKGYFGETPKIPNNLIPLQGSIFEQIIKRSTHSFSYQLEQDTSKDFSFLRELGLRCIDGCRLSVRGNITGILVLGFSEDTHLEGTDLIRFEEFSQAAAVTIVNATTQERINTYAEHLEDLVNKRTADLVIQTSRAEEANKAKSQFLANMSHELRTPLTAIVGYSSVLKDGIFGPVNKEQGDALQAIVRSSDHLKQLIDDVLNLARIESGKEEAKPENVSLKELINHAQKMMQQQAIEKNIKIIPAVLSDEIANKELFVDRKHAHQIIINLMGNAVKYTQQGGEVWSEASIVGDKIKISVCDTGIGIPPEKIGKLFERFERGDDSYSKEQEGTGIGLNLTQHLVELNGGRIGVESEVGKGSKFWFLLPLFLQDDNSKLIDDKENIALSDLSGISALIVDDNQDTCKVSQSILLAAKASTEVVNSVKEAMEKISENYIPDIILTDLAMPKESGLDLIKRIKALPNENMRKVPVVVLSACAFQKDKDSVFEAGAKEFIAKPFKPNELTQVVKKVVEDNK